MRQGWTQGNREIKSDLRLRTVKCNRQVKAKGLRDWKPNFKVKIWTWIHERRYRPWRPQAWYPSAWLAIGEYAIGHGGESALNLLNGRRYGLNDKGQGSPNTRPMLRHPSLIEQPQTTWLKKPSEWHWAAKDIDNRHGQWHEDACWSVAEQR